MKIQCMKADIIMKFKAIIINSEVVTAISKSEWTIDELDDIYIIRKTKIVGHPELSSPFQSDR